MHLRANQLPELGGPLVLRFRAAGGEVLAEAEVAWHSEGKLGCDFGVRFTALDSLSLKTLGSLCGGTAQAGTLGDLAAFAAGAGIAPKPKSQPTALEREFFGSGVCQTDSANEVEPEGAETSAVRLHIDGVAQPMRAQVRQLAPGRLSVGSSLDFLSVGKSVEVEDVVTGGRHPARIGDVGVRVDPKSQVPELLVSVRYAAGSNPLGGSLLAEANGGRGAKPALAENNESAEVRPRAAESSASGFDLPSGEPEAGTDEGEEDDDEDGSEDESPEADASLAHDAVLFARTLARGCGRAGATVGNGARTVLRSVRVFGGGRRKLQTSSVRRTTAAPVSRQRNSALRQGVRFDGPRSNSASKSVKSSRGRLVVMAAAALLGGGLWFMGGSSVPSATPSVALTKLQVANNPASGSVSVSDAAESKGPVEATSKGRSVAAQGKTRAGELAQKPARLVRGTGSSSGPETESTVKPRIFSRGRLHLPIIHRIKLDAPGASLHGKSTLTGFDVRIPGRKTVESASTMTRRDDRIAKVGLTNTGEGAKISVRFHRAIPPYKVRLKKDYVEIFISSK